MLSVAFVIHTLLTKGLNLIVKDRAIDLKDLRNIL